MISRPANGSRTFVPATGLNLLLPFYDPLSYVFTRLPKLKKNIVAALDLHPGNSVLDMGCGTGTLLSTIQAAFPDIHSVGIDIDHRVLSRAKSKCPSSALFQCSMEVLPFSDSQFDQIVCSMAFHHLVDLEKRKVLREALRVCRPAGQLLLIDYAEAANALAAMLFLPVRILDGWDQTRANAGGQLPKFIQECGWQFRSERFQLGTPLGTIRAYAAFHSK